MGKRRIYRQTATFTAGADRAFEGINLAETCNVLIHQMFINFPAGNAFARCYAKRQDRHAIQVNDLIAEEYGLDNGCTFNDPILLTLMEAQRIQVYIGTVTTGGAFKLNIDYEEVS